MIIIIYCKLPRKLTTTVIIIKHVASRTLLLKRIIYYLRLKRIMKTRNNRV